MMSYRADRLVAGVGVDEYYRRKETKGRMSILGVTSDLTHSSFWISYNSIGVGHGKKVHVTILAVLGQLTQYFWISHDSMVASRKKVNIPEMEEADQIR